VLGRYDKYFHHTTIGRVETDALRKYVQPVEFLLGELSLRVAASRFSLSRASIAALFCSHDS